MIDGRSTPKITTQSTDGLGFPIHDTVTISNLAGTSPFGTVAEYVGYGSCNTGSGGRRRSLGPD